MSDMTDQPDHAPENPAAHTVIAAGQGAEPVAEYAQPAAEPAPDSMTAASRDGMDLSSRTGLESSPLFLGDFKTDADALTASIEASFARTSEGLTAFNIKAVDALRENVNSTFEFWEQMIGVRTLAQAFEVQSTHTRKQVQALGEQSQSLSALVQKIAQDSFEPMRVGIRSAAAISA